MTAQLDTIDPTFVADLERSTETVWFAARWLSKLGYQVSIPPTRIRPDSSQALDYSDECDLMMVQRVEIKRRPSLHFTSATDFPYATVIVDVAHKIEKFKKQAERPFMYLIFNDDCSACIIVPGRTFKHWNTITKFDGHAGRSRQYYECPIEYVIFQKINV